MSYHYPHFADEKVEAEIARVLNLDWLASYFSHYSCDFLGLSYAQNVSCSNRSHCPSADNVQVTEMLTASL